MPKRRSRRNPAPPSEAIVRVAAPDWKSLGELNTQQVTLLKNYLKIADATKTWN